MTVTTEIDPCLVAIAAELPRPQYSEVPPKEWTGAYQVQTAARSDFS